MLTPTADRAAAGLPASTPSSDTEPAKAALLDVIACDGADTSAIVVAAHGLGAEVRLTNSPENWFEQQARPLADDSAQVADLVLFVGVAERMVTQRWVARAAKLAAQAHVVAVMIDASLEQVTTVVNQGARGLMVLPNSPERVAFQLRDLLEPAARRQPERQAMARHRRAMTTLTKAEIDVLDGMLEGLANKQIAQRLSIGLRTVELRRSKIMKKMGATSLAQLISFVCLAKQES